MAQNFLYSLEFSVKKFFSFLSLEFFFENLVSEFFSKIEEFFSYAVFFWQVMNPEFFLQKLLPRIILAQNFSWNNFSLRISDPNSSKFKPPGFLFQNILNPKFYKKNSSPKFFNQRISALKFSCQNFSILTFYFLFLFFSEIPPTPKFQLPHFFLLSHIPPLKKILSRRLWNALVTSPLVIPPPMLYC